MTATLEQTLPLSGNRGRLRAAAATSLARVDDALGRLLDINSAWRSPWAQQQLYDAYKTYLRYGKPWAPIALPPDQSVHCDGRAIDTDDYSDARAVRILNEHGWFQTVWRWVNGKLTLVEPWHFEYDEARDKFKGQPAGGGSKPLPIPKPEPIKEDDDMYRAKSKKSGNWYVIGEFTVTRILAGASGSKEHAHALAYSESAGVPFPVLESDQITALMNDAKVRAAEFSKALAARIDLLITEESK